MTAGYATNSKSLVGPDFTRRPVKYERFIRPMGLRYKKANVTHKELGVTVTLPICECFQSTRNELNVTDIDEVSVKKNPQNPTYTQLGVLTRGTVIEVNVRRKYSSSPAFETLTFSAGLRAWSGDYRR